MLFYAAVTVVGVTGSKTRALDLVVYNTEGLHLSVPMEHKGHSLLLLLFLLIHSEMARAAALNF